MNRVVRTAVAALFALSLVLQAPAAFAAGRERDRDFSPGFIQRIVKTVKQVLKPFMTTVQDDDEFIPGPPKP
jgi:hypothetical protein